MTCRDIDKCENCPIKDECDEVDNFREEKFDSGAFDHELLAKIYTKGKEEAFTQIIMYLNDASLAQSGKCYDCTKELMKIIEKMEGEQE